MCKELKDIILKKGDIVTLKYSDGTINELEVKSSICDTSFAGIVLKIERPKYETIYEAPKEILTQEEKEYLEAICKPFKGMVKFIKKCLPLGEWICIQVDNEYISFPYFKEGTMYKGMEQDKEYNLKELGLFE